MIGVDQDPEHALACTGFNATFGLIPGFDQIQSNGIHLAESGKSVQFIGKPGTYYLSDCELTNDLVMPACGCWWCHR
jgi:hypothetical protein